MPRRQLHEAMGNDWLEPPTRRHKTPSYAADCFEGECIGRNVLTEARRISKHTLQSARLPDGAGAGDVENGSNDLCTFAHRCDAREASVDALIQ
jgi:hypothetical protein